MLVPEPIPTRWDLHWRMFGAEVRIRPIFWASCSLVGIVIYRDPEIGGVTMFTFWIAAVLFSLLARETSHILAARLFGTRVRAALSGMGGQLYGLEERKPWQRVLILLAGTLGNLLILGILWGITEWPFLPADWRVTLAPYVWLLLWINAFWTALNLLPLWPLDGGRVAVEIGETLLGPLGRKLALVASLVVCSLLVVSIIMWARLTLIARFDQRYIVHFSFFCIQILYCYCLWVSAFRVLWGDPVALDETAKSGRAA